MTANGSAKSVALVTGGAKRVGRAIVERLAAEGFVVAFTYHTRQDAADELKASLRDAVHPIRADLSKPLEAVEAIRKGMSHLDNRLNVLVNNASIYEPSGLHVTDLAQMRRMMAIHYETPLLLAQAFEHPLRVSRASLINLTDLLAERPWPQYAAYCASKAALVNLTKSLARELAPEVTVNAIAPGVVDWPDDYPEEEKKKYLDRVPLKRAGSPSDVASLVHFLATEGKYITGQIIRLDGGRSIT